MYVVLQVAAAVVERAVYVPSDTRIVTSGARRERRLGRIFRGERFNELCAGCPLLVGLRSVCS